MHTTAKAAALDILRRTPHGRIEAIDERRVRIAAAAGASLHVAEYRAGRIAAALRDKGWTVEEIAMDGVEATQPTAVDVPFISPALVRAAREAAALDQRIGGEGFTALTIKVGLYGEGWSLDDNSDAVLRYADGGVLYCSPFRPVPEGLPASMKAASERRHAAAQELRRLVAELPFTGEGLSIPLHAYAA